MYSSSTHLSSTNYKCNWAKQITIFSRDTNINNRYSWRITYIMAYYRYYNLFPSFHCVFQSTEEFWKAVFLLSATLNIIPSALFTIWGSARLQPWNQGPKYYRNKIASQEKHAEQLNQLTYHDKSDLVK